jgi:CDP-diacylglycerol--glycerol-3-phosphate 3-phosphatidyltransferase
MANIITGIRIICSIALLFFPALSPAFYILYITAGVSTMATLAAIQERGTPDKATAGCLSLRIEGLIM